LEERVISGYVLELYESKIDYINGKELEIQKKDEEIKKKMKKFTKKLKKYNKKIKKLKN
jgi:peptidoglycan hydrolase CwlO-like protein